MEERAAGDYRVTSVVLDTHAVTNTEKTMTTLVKLMAVVSELPESQQLEVLQFAESLANKVTTAQAARDTRRSDTESDVEFEAFKRSSREMWRKEREDFPE